MLLSEELCLLHSGTCGNRQEKSIKMNAEVVKDAVLKTVVLHPQIS